MTNCHLSKSKTDRQCPEVRDRAGWSLSPLLLLVSRTMLTPSLQTSHVSPIYPAYPCVGGKLLWTLWQINPAFAPIVSESTPGIPLFSKAVTDSAACMYMHLNFQEFISALYMKWIWINENKKTMDEVNSNSVECSRKIRLWWKPVCQRVIS